MESPRLQVAGIAFTAVLAAVGAAAVVGGLGYGAVDDAGLVGPGFMPIFAGGLMLIFALIDIMQRVRHTVVANRDAKLALDTSSFEALEHELEDETKLDVDIFGRSQRFRNRQLVAVIGILVVTLLLVNVLGFILAFGLMLVAIAVLVERRAWLSSVIVSVVALAAAYLIFGVFLRVPLPQGLLGIL
ncbi:tripartite tricarboxylate transporter TctB family protein [Agromyces humatus]|uniref:DUF1468 domain-containing protein n=1 Tax=Agromyces humatus TaxID=279573 RepID=A0ABN2L045_9MICO|nr:tripartite tricarboxylate transporter TctB family protein [Agromyces humatus]